MGGTKKRKERYEAKRSRMTLSTAMFDKFRIAMLSSGESKNVSFLELLINTHEEHSKNCTGISAGTSVGNVDDRSQEQSHECASESFGESSMCTRKETIENRSTAFASTPFKGSGASGKFADDK
ncbi:uncharacterized protein LOC129260067 [Lytechinus pictus]|uniref:uncharacterized protein LOC129260067 n=1 Tax=Lytechinus pictus TaxID=7653 RepID=UPI00240E4DBC|nr:uncharacterized protein LOC129260067 [Lytechinus pictus]